MSLTLMPVKAMNVLFRILSLLDSHFLLLFSRLVPFSLSLLVQTVTLSVITKLRSPSVVFYQAGNISLQLQ